MKKRIAMIMAVSMMCVISGCGEKDEAKTTEQTTTVEATSEVTTEVTTNATTEVTTEATTEAVNESKNEDDASESDASTEVAVEGEVSSEGDYKAGVSADAATVNAFALVIKKAYLEGDWNTISDMIMYPITMYPDVECKNADEFLEYMNGKKVDDSDRAEMEKETCSNMFARDLGVCMGSGSVWIGEDPETKELGIKSISGIVEE